MASASAGASEMTSSFPPRRWLGIGTVLVVTTSVTSGADSIRFSASPANRPCVQATRTDRAWRSLSRSSSSRIVVPRAISSSSTITSRPATSPMMDAIVTSSSLIRCLAPNATGSPSRRAKAAACLALPRSGETTTVFDMSWPRKWLASSRSACR